MLHFQRERKQNIYNAVRLAKYLQNKTKHGDSFDLKFRLSAITVFNDINRAGHARGNNATTT